MAMAVKEKKEKTRKKIPKALIYEMRYGSPIYYRDYDKVLSGEKKLEEVVGSSGLQFWIIDLIVRFLHKSLDSRKYQLGYNEAGFKFAPRSWYNLDIGIWEKEEIKPFLKRNELVPIPPLVVIEVDTKADLRKFTTPQDYFHRKTQDLLDHGVERVIWIFTKDKKVWIAERGSPWLIVDWNYEIPIVEGLSFNLQKLTEEEEK